MFKKFIPAALAVIVLSGFQHPKRPPHFVNPVYQDLPLGAIRPSGWLRDQLETMRQGSTGRLDEIYWKLRDDNGWLGGKGDGWEETPYWLDGTVPLAYLLDDNSLKAKVYRYLNWTITHQRASGYFGPITKAERDSGVTIDLSTCTKGEDWWPKMVMLKALQQYYTASGDERVLTFMTRYFHYELHALKRCPVNKWSDWAQSRGTENILVAQWLYQKTRDPQLLLLAGELNRQCYPWTSLLGGRTWVMQAAAQQNDSDWMLRHGVNVAMALKAPALEFQRSGDSSYLQAIKTGFSDIMTLHGLPNGAFSADEDLHGNLPTQGTEMCAVVEDMFSLEQLMAISGDPRYMDALERIAFNALPAQTTDDYMAKQYFQVANQVEIARGVFDFSLPFGRGMNNVLGMRSGYTCCLANMHQGWTKFAQHLWYKSAENGLASLIYAPNRLNTTVGKANTAISVEESTDYPFSDEIAFTLSLKMPATFAWQLRIPSWCRDAVVSINGRELDRPKGGRVVTVQRIWKDKDRLVLKLPMQVSTSNWGRNSRTIERGPLVYALKLAEHWEKAQEPHEGDYFSVYPSEKWNYGLTHDVISDPEKKLKVATKALSGRFVWNQEHAPIQITATGRAIPAWKLVDGVAYQPVTDRDGEYRGIVGDTVRTIALIPYGFTKCRIVAFPVVKK